ncbi:alpha/beta hydrolase [Maribacter hydrothermalis]|uniref:1,4-beta-xylanase n=1 Tax=Maribacter hydrothermalis TaxID=1836467 RepID=A0A1B7Z1U4_9FLAO|nr:alpha/beta hydrolase [Maribacter hydrothermalis]APQ18280.1 1,4-beta-xylanase [Maribacter hydrothermalis]OBR36626.1 1,4-beta-xylanase [Maribacter hydrothermalis]
MKKIVLIIIFFISMNVIAQNIVDLPFETDTNVNWSTAEKEYYSDIWDTKVITNVSVPRLEVYEADQPNGTSVIVAPGGGLYGLSIESEGRMVAKWLNNHGITAFVLKYRLVPTGTDGIKEITEEGTTNPAKIGERVAPVLPLSIADGHAAITYVRTNANAMKLDPEKIGFMGFSAGGAVTMGVTFNYAKANRPDFIVPVYPWMTVMGEYKVPEDAPPMLVICASDDPLGLARPSTTLYTDWVTSGKNAGMHMYSKGGHGFGMKQQQLASDNWIVQFYAWALTEGLTKPSLN